MRQAKDRGRTFDVFKGALTTSPRGGILPATVEQKNQPSKHAQQINTQPMRSAERQQHARLERLNVSRPEWPLNFTFVYDPLDRDMVRMLRTRVLEPTLSRVWHELTWKCCRHEKGVVVDVGSNYGWYTLLAASLGCDVLAVDPVPSYQRILKRNLDENGLQHRVTMRRAVVYNERGTFNVSVPIAVAGGQKRRKVLGMTGMHGVAGVLKSDSRDRQAGGSYLVSAASVSLDKLLAAYGTRPICMLKLDVEGYEPQALLTARDTLDSGRVRALQVEVNRVYAQGAVQQNLRVTELLEELDRRRFRVRQVHSKCAHARKAGSLCVDSADALPPDGVRWEEAPSVWARLDEIPSNRSRQRAANARCYQSIFADRFNWSGRPSAMEHAFRDDIVGMTADIVAIPTGVPPAAAHEHACVAPPLALRQRRYQYEYRYKRETVASGGVRTRVSAVSVSQAGAASVTGDGVRVRAHSKPG